MKSFNPLIYLAALGAGGIAIMPFAFLQYTFHKGAGLVVYEEIGHGTISVGAEIFYRSLEGVMIVFALVHISMMVAYAPAMFKWIKTRSYKEFISDPLKNAGLLAPFIAIFMTLNVMIGPVRFFIPAMQSGFQDMILPAFLIWSGLFAALMRMEIKLLKISFIHGYDIDKISFGWLLHPFALGMATVVGTGIAAMSKTVWIAHLAAFMSLVSGTMGIFLLGIKLFVLFKSHFARKGLPEKQFLPSLLIVIPNITLFAISAFRIGHYLEHMHGIEMGAYLILMITAAFAFQTWYLLFGLSLLKEYFARYYFRREYYISQWGLICPIVAYGVLGSFVYKVFVPNLATYTLVLITIAVAVVFYTDLLIRHASCVGWKSRRGMKCLS